MNQPNKTKQVLGLLHQRAYRSQQQKWELAAACIEHLQLALEHLGPVVGALDGSAVNAPGLDVMLDLLGACLHDLPLMLCFSLPTIFAARAQA